MKILFNCVINQSKGWQAKAEAFHVQDLGSRHGDNVPHLAVNRAALLD
jgi:hypothetical protein